MTFSCQAETGEFNENYFRRRKEEVFLLFFQIFRSQQKFERSCIFKLDFVVSQKIFLPVYFKTCSSTRFISLVLVQQTIINNLFGHVKFIQQIIRDEIKPILENGQDAKGFKKC